MSWRRRVRASSSWCRAGACLVSLCLSDLSGAQAELPAAAPAERFAVFRLDSLGVEQQIVERLDGLLRMEVSRLAGTSLPAREQVSALLRRRADLRNCTGGVGCLSAIGAALGVDKVIAGNVGGLAASYVVNLKLVDVDQRREVRRIQETLSGAAHQLIEAVRVAAYGLVAPERWRGALRVLVSLPGADVYLNGELLGQSPLPTRHGLRVGTYTLRVSKRGYEDTLRLVKIRFQKTAEVVVQLQAPASATQPTAQAASVRGRQLPWYTKWWFWTAVGVAATGVGAALGWALASRPGVDCGKEPAACGL
jgi:hypothetical protein